MEFGRLPKSALDSVDFALPKEPDFNKQILKGKRAKGIRAYTGLNMWGNKQWNGLLYPVKTKEQNKLSLYAKKYNAVELNATHYNIYPQTTIAAWAAKVDPGFLFCPKMYQGITHDGSLVGKEVLVHAFCESIAALGPRLGPVFIQLSDTFSPTRKNELEDFLASLPTGFQYFLELRNALWFSHENHEADLFNKLSLLNIGSVITDTAGRRDCAHMHLTIPKAFIRYVGNSLHPTDYTRSDAWVNRMKYWLDNGLEALYFFMHMHDEATSPELTMYLVDKMNAALGVDLLKPKLVDQQATLF